MKTAFPLRAAAAALLLLSVGCRAPGFAEARLSLPSPGEAATLVVQVDDQPITLRFDPMAVDYAEWAAHPVDDAPPPPLEALPPGSRPVGAWVLRVRLRGTKALVPSVFLVERNGSGLLYSTRHVTGRLEPGAGFDLTGDGTIRLADPAAPPPVQGFIDVPVDVK